MVLYFRYKLFEYIKINANKVYTKDFSVKIGNLLPAPYETEYGEFLWERFFDEYLLRLNVDAEKIVIYLTPFVLKIDLNIIIYEFDTDSSVLKRDFPSNLDNKPDITLLFRKTHYDLVYCDKYFEKYTKELCYYVNLEENLKVVKSSDLEKYRNNPPRQMSNNNNIPSNNNNIINENRDNVTHINEGGFRLCSICNHEYIHRPNVFNICINCLSNEITSEFMANYLLFVNEAVSYYHERKDYKIPELFNESIYIFIN